MSRLICGLAAAAILFSASCTKKGGMDSAEMDVSPEAKASKTCDINALRDMKTNYAFISYAYCVVLARPADEAGRSYWMRSLTVRNDRLAMFMSFAASPEFASGIYNGQPAKKLSDDDFLVYAFKRLLNRAPAEEEVKDWKKKAAKGKWSRSVLAQELMKTRESRELHHL